MVQRRQVVQQQREAEVDGGLGDQVHDVGATHVPRQRPRRQVRVQALLAQRQRREAVRQAEAGEEPEEGLAGKGER